MHLPTLPLSLLALALALTSSSSASHLPNRRSHPRIALDERGMPITATTTVHVEMTTTHTVWVQPTGGQAVFVPSAGGVTASAVFSSASSSEASSSGSPSETSSSDSSSGYDTSISSSPPSSSSSFATSADESTTTPSSSAALPSMTATDLIASYITSSSSRSGMSRTSGVNTSGYNGVRPSPTPTPSASASSTASASESQSSAVSSVTDEQASSSSLIESSTTDAASSTTSSVVTSSTTSSDVLSSTTSSDVSSSTTSSGVPSSTTSLDVMSATASSGMVSSTASSDAASSTTSSDTASSITASITASSTTLWSSSTSSSSTTSTSASASSTSLPSLPSRVMAGYFPDWSTWYLPPESVDFSKFDVIDFAFALPTSDNNLEFTQTDSSDTLTRLVALAHAAGTRVKLSIGGWTGSQYFSTIVGDSSSRSAFVANILVAYRAYDLDGIDIDWEYPGTQGAGSNAVSSADSANFLLFLQELRTALPDGALITLATQVWPFAGSNGQPMSDVSAFASVIDWILIMNYDVWGSSSTPGSNAPLSDGCGNSSQPLANAYAAVSSWTTAGMPANQITLGLAAYGYLQMSTASSLKDRRHLDAPNKPWKKSEDRRASKVTVSNDGGGTTDGQVGFAGLVNQGALVVGSDGSYVGGGGFVREWDSCSSTPWIKSKSSGQIITYDDPESISLKGQFAAQAGLRGCNVWSMDNAYVSSGWPLIDAARSGMGI